MRTCDTPCGVDAVLRDKVVLITGAARGIGLACAQLAGRLGARLVLNDVGCDVGGEGADPAVVALAAESLRAAGADVVADARDLCDDGTPEALCELAIQRFGRLDGVVSCAGVRQRARLASVSAGQRQRLYAVGVEAPLALLQAAQARMPRPEGGSLVFMTGGAAFQGQRRDVGAAMAQAALVGLVRTAALELRGDGIRVNAVAPTALTRQTEDLPLFQSGGARLSPDHVAPLVAHLLSDRARAVSGQVLGVAGSRFFAHEARETDGYFGETDAPLTLDAIAAHWDAATR